MGESSPTNNRGRLGEKSELFSREERSGTELDVEYERQSEVKTRYIGKGRGSANREQKEIEKVRYQITKVKRNEEAIIVTCQHFGWKAFVTNATITALSLNDAILTYRNEYRVETDIQPS
jgi:transposase